MGDERQKIKLELIAAPSRGPVVHAPPVLKASPHTIDYLCGSCGEVLLQADAGQVHNLQIQCAMCGSYNATSR